MKPNFSWAFKLVGLEQLIFINYSY